MKKTARGQHPWGLEDLIFALKMVSFSSVDHWEGEATDGMMQAAAFMRSVPFDAPQGTACKDFLLDLVFREMESEREVREKKLVLYLAFQHMPLGTALEIFRHCTEEEWGRLGECAKGESVECYSSFTWLRQQSSLVGRLKHPKVNNFRELADLQRDALEDKFTLNVYPDAAPVIGIEREGAVDFFLVNADYSLRLFASYPSERVLDGAFCGAWPKLVRDGVPEMIRGKEGFAPETFTAGGDMLSAYVDGKIKEEAEELMAAETIEDVAGELADLVETAFKKARCLDPGLSESGFLAAVEAKRLEKRKKRGGFEKNVIMRKPVPR